MRKCMSWLMLLVMLLASVGTCYAEESAEAAQFIMAGFDGEDSNHDWMTNKFFQRMVDRTGITFDYVQYTAAAAWTQAKAAMLAGGTEAGSMPDVLFKAALTQEDQLTGYESGALIDLKPYLEQYAPTLWAMLTENPGWLEAISLPNGAIVALPGVNQLQSNNAMWINTQWLENLGLSMPTTAEELTAVLRAFKTSDPNRNGNRDEIPLSFSSMWDLRFLSHAFGLVSNDYYVVMDEGGTVSSILQTEENRAFLTWLHELWTEELIDHSGFLTADEMRRVTDGDAAMTYGMFFSPTPMNLLPATALEQYSLLPPLTYEGKQVYREFAGELVPGTFAITSACEDPAALVSWVDFLYTEDGNRLMQAGLEDVEYSWSSDGTWSWVYDAETVATTVLFDTTINDGTPAPGLSSLDFQLTYDDQATRRVLEMLVELKDVAVQPYPTVWLTAEQQAKVDAIQLDAGYYAEQQMVWFVTGDVELNDDTWSDFCQTLDEKGMADLVAILQEAVQ